MLNALLDATVSVPESALYALIGFLIVFCGIAFLIFIVWFIGRCMAFMQGQPFFAKPQKTQPVKKEKPAPKAVAQPVAVADSEEISEETVAVITAALMAYYQQAKPECGFIVKRIKRI